ncbi:Nif11-like leader peptide family natural product precursor [Desulfosporosinus lacus]|uniref:Nif11-like leader peptide domain-containing protein n=1 Tax=Desulfosporosinus lacus DSM 15449 TaxID=1121420 RepID=A0A1M5QWK7_9FIRM|nr:Nif11-like leader peptide family natural product precursor [Desulfosporosinus lacus]SHH18301.1 nif11-like leader peptide domain-containing protein [Desulfosporosinus lacus DSM 15449]
MSTEIQRFSTDLRDNQEMQKEIKNMGSDMGKIVAYANSKGYTFTVADVDAKKGELSEEQLDKVAGGNGGILVAW